jgi:hypothetical protein
MNRREIMVFGLVVLLVLLGGLLFLGLIWVFSGFGFGMMGGYRSGMMGPGMMGGNGLIGSLLLCLAPLVLLAVLLLAGAVIWLVFRQGS